MMAVRTAGCWELQSAARTAAWTALKMVFDWAVEKAAMMGYWKDISKAFE
jgi:hypothetical protein